MGWGWCGEGECMEGRGVDRLSISHRAHDGGLPLNDPDAEVLGLHLLALLVGYEEPADMLLRLIWVPLRPWVVPVVMVTVVVNSWQCRSDGQGFLVLGGPRRLGQGNKRLGRGDKGVSSGHGVQDDPQGVAHWVIGTNSGWRGVLGPEG